MLQPSSSVYRSGNFELSPLSNPQSWYFSFHDGIIAKWVKAFVCEFGSVVIAGSIPDLGCTDTESMETGE